MEDRVDVPRFRELESGVHGGGGQDFEGAMVTWAKFGFRVCGMDISAFEPHLLSNCEFLGSGCRSFVLYDFYGNL